MHIAAQSNIRMSDMEQAIYWQHAAACMSHLVQNTTYSTIIYQKRADLAACMARRYLWKLMGGNPNVDQYYA